MKDIKVLGIDLAKDVFQLHGTDAKGRRIEEFHKSIKQNASLEKSPTKKVKTQCNMSTLL